MKHLNRYQYRGFWIEIFLEPSFEQSRFKEDSFNYSAMIELWGNHGCISVGSYSDKENAEFAAEELIDSWN